MQTPDVLAQLVGIGTLWLSVHCVGMCGPLLVGLGIAGGPGDMARGVARTLLYQAGRAVPYALFGALSGGLGASLSQLHARSGPVLAVAFGGLGLLHALGLVRLRLPATEAPVRIGAARPPSLFQRVVAVVSSRDHVLRPVALGMVLGFLPCMIVAWALSLAALSGSAARGALVMLTLVAMTTPWLLSLTLLARAFAPVLRRASPAARRALGRVPALLSSVWLVLIGLAGLGVIPHQSAGFTAMGRAFMLMLF